MLFPIYLRIVCIFLNVRIIWLLITFFALKSVQTHKNGQFIIRYRTRKRNKFIKIITMTAFVVDVF